ncbi:hypothetical protein Tcan_04343 [Toxocara canis]|uniref:Uncharacterized protein n=1 Tax=Toxocara canis TaxID=6265 RepID=A0A0B2VP99_TOXCA|nr:hypothetical protein Tcan_04343 [Toxocara canis]
MYKCVEVLCAKGSFKLKDGKAPSAAMLFIYSFMWIAKCNVVLWQHLLNMLTNVYIVHCRGSVVIFLVESALNEAILSARIGALVALACAVLDHNALTSLRPGTAPVTPTSSGGNMDGESEELGREGLVEMECEKGKGGKEEEKV